MNKRIPTLENFINEAAKSGIVKTTVGKYLDWCFGETYKYDSDEIEDIFVDYEDMGFNSIDDLNNFLKKHKSDKIEVEWTELPNVYTHSFDIDGIEFDCDAISPPLSKTYN